MEYRFVDAARLDADLTAVADAIRSKSGTAEALAFPSGMTSAISAISTGVELNFQVAGNPEPTDPEENTIWINTDEPVTGWTFRADEPETPDPGMVWILTGVSGAMEFNALKENGLQVCPLSAKQYIGGVWVDKAAKSRQNGVWVDWRMDIFKDGGIRLGELSTSTPTRLYVENSEIVFKNTNGNGSWGYFTETADLTNYKKLKAKIKQSSAHNTNYALVSVTPQIPTAETLANIKGRSGAYLELTVTDGVYHELETSVQGLSGMHYVEIAAIAAGAVSEIWLE